MHHGSFLKALVPLFSPKRSSQESTPQSGIEMANLAQLLCIDKKRRLLIIVLDQKCRSFARRLKLSNLTQSEI